MTVSTTTPFVNETNIVASDDIILIFDATLDGTTLNATNIRAMGSRSGLHSAVYSGGGTTSLTINPDVDFFAGEKVTVTITDGVLALSTQAAVPYTLSFTIETGPFEGAFIKQSTALEGVVDGAASWADYDGDGDFDVVVSGYDFEYGGVITKIFSNSLGNFEDIFASLTGAYEGSVDWGDYDNDGDLDLFLTGFSDLGVPLAILYRNDAGTFTNAGETFQGVAFSEADWGDFDSDGDLDLVVQGKYNSNFPALTSTIIYRNDAGTFVDHNAVVTGVYEGGVAWGDYDSDGDLDLVSSGTTDSDASTITTIYRNDAGVFTDIVAGLEGKSVGKVAWGDYDSDGDLDLLVSGSGADNAPIIYRNDAGVFVDSNAGLLENGEGEFAWGDYDGDGDLDLVINGSGETNDPTTTIYINNSGTYVNSGIKVDNYIYGTADWGDFDNDGDLDLLMTGTDDFNGGRIALYLNTLAPPAIYNATNVTTEGFTPNLIAPPGAVDLLVDVSTDPAFGSFLPSGQNISVGISGGVDISVTLTPGTQYFYRAKTDFGGSESSYYVSNGFMVRQGNALPFTVDDYVEMFDSPILEPAGAFTIEFWFSTTATGNKVFIEKGNSDTEYSVQQSLGDQITLVVNGGSMQTNGTYNDGVWHHVAVVYRGAGDGTIYVDGVDDTDTGTNTLGTPAYSFGRLTIGARRTAGTLNLEGSIDDVRIWDGERTLSEINDNRYSTLVGNEAGLLAYYRFDEVSGVVLPDLTGNGLNGELKNMTGTEWIASGVPDPAETIYVKADASGLNNGTSWTNAYTDLQDALAAAADGDQIWVANGVYRPDGINAGNTSLSFVITQNDLSIFGGFDGIEGSLGERYADPSQTVLSGDLNGDDDFNFSFISDNSNNVVIISNVTGVYLDGLTISGGNAAGDGGGIYSSTAEFSINNVFVEYNYAGTSGGGAYITGTSITILNSHFQNNQATTGGGAYLDASEPFIYRSVFQYNDAVSGGGLYMNGSNLIDNSVSYYNKFLNNGATATTGGGIYLQESYFEAFQNLFAGNFAYDYGGAIVVDDLSTSIVVNSTIADNASNDGPGALNFFSGASIQIDNSIFWGNTSVAQAGSLKNFNDGGAFTIQNSIVEDWDNTAYAAETESNIYLTDPLFINSANQDYHLLLASPAIDAGDNFVLEQPWYIDIFDEDQDADYLEYAPYDLGKNPRYYNFTVDLGAFEHQGNPDPLLFAYVDVNAVGNNDGSTWTDAFTDLQSALAAAVDGTEIWVAAGNYYPSGDDPSIPFVIPTGTSVYGGFNGTETNLSQRDPVTNVTSLDGDSPNFLNSYLVVYIGGSGNNARLDGFTISGGSGEFGTDNYGGGIKIEGGADPILANLTIQLNQNDFGAGLYVGNSTVTIEKSSFLSNSVINFGTGGAIYADNAIIKISNSYFNNNTAWEAGGIYLSNGSSLLAVSVDFDTNSAFGLNGGAIGSLDSDISLTNGRFYNNSGNPGAGIYFKSASSDHSVILTQTTFTTSSSSDGVAVVSSGGFVSSAVISNSVLWANAGSQINIIDDGSNLDISNSVVDSWNIGDYSGFAGTITAANISVADPLFTSSGTGDLSIQSGSSAQDFGDISFLPLDDLDVDNDANTVEVLPLDLAGNPRISNAQVDAGTYEIQVGPGPFVVTSNNGETPVAAVNNGTPDVVVAGLAVNITAGTTLTRVAFTSSVDLSKSFQNYRLYYSVDQFFSTGGDNVLLSSSPFLSITDIEFQSLSEVLTAADHYLFLVADTKIEANPTQPGISFASSELGIDFSTGTVDPFTYSGPTITFKAGPIFSATAQNNTGSEVTVGSGSSGIVLLEALISANQYAELTALTYNFSEDPQANLQNFQLVISADNSLATTGDNAIISPTLVTASNASFDLTNEPLYVAGKYFYFIADSRADATGTGAPLTFSMDDASISVAFGLVTGISVISDPLVVTTVVTPTAPTGLTLGKNSANEVTGNFPTSGAEGYVVIRRLTSSAAYVPQNGAALTQGATPATDNYVVQVGATFSFTDTGLVPSTDYTYDVYAFNGTGSSTIYSATSATSSILTYPATPTDAGALAISKDKANAISGSFNGFGSDGYVVIRKLTSAASYTPVTGVPLTQGSTPAADNTVIQVDIATSFTDTGLLPETDYTYLVYAFNGTGAETVYSINPVIASVLSFASTPIEQASGLVLTQNGAVVTGSFTAAADAASYLILRRLVGIVDTAPLDAADYVYGEIYSEQFVVQSATALTFSDTLSEVAGTEIFYDIYSFNGTTATTNYNVTSPLQGSIVLEAIDLTPTWLAATNITSFGFQANWSASEAVDGYRLEIATDGLFTNYLPGYNPFETADTVASVTGLYHATSYFMRIKAFNADGETAYSDTLEVKTLKSDELTEDSTALVKIYDEMGGAGWTNSANWKAAQVRGWSGVVVENSRVTALNLPSNNVTGAFPTMTGTELNALVQLDLANNQITTVPANANLSALQTLNVSNNRLDFGSLEQFAGVTTFSYSPQADLFTAVDLLQERGEPLSIDRTSAGTSNQYQWYKNGTVIDGATGPEYTIAFPTFAEEGSYTAQINNTQLPNLTLTTLPVALRVSSLERDRLILTELYNLLGGDSWNNNTNWNTADIATWFGITVANDRVTGITLPSNNLLGELPVRLGDMRRLTVIDISNNEVSSLPTLTNIIALTTLNVSNNRLQFDDLEPNIGIASINYAPQKLTGQARDEKIAVNTAVTVEVPVGGTANSYQWYHNGSSIAAGTSSTYQLGPIRYENMGSYELEITSSKVAGLTLRSEVQKVLGTATITGLISDLNNASVANANGALLGVKTGAYDTTGFYNSAANGGFEIKDIVLGDYLLYAEQDHQKYIPSYYRSTIDWVFADLIQLRDNIGDLVLTMVNVPRELTPADGDNTFKGLFESDFGDTGGKVLDRSRVQGAGVSVSRSRFRAKDNEDDYELIAYVQTDETGQFEMNNLPDGDYRVNIQYPGIPMDPTSFIDFQLGGGTGVEQNSIRINALATPTSIVVTKVEETGIYLDYFKGLTVYPNPADDYITIRYEKLVKGEVVAELMDLNGQTIMSKAVRQGTSQQTVLDLTDVKNGLYILRFFDKHGNGVEIVSFRLIVKK
ncbi:LamG-like jellyroll fold domain-containing protein [Imperialibacter roseus]|uniref:LamG-like jellyroll fold domain-containing protein n=1 Tax=Imperialibacter roseus TaxID=1324217 RepID=A0ABZ0IRA1_9BACT|nr:LamG-like jellyroll fold domain-containing protein [Imperialibacter roseus]WOK06112.1 LamG-like jellyroll fold domain-containing protein [Imperialibacter roseus]